jgi:hypothetical protein
MEVRGQFHAPAALPPGKDPPVHIGGPQNRSGHGGEERNSHPLARLEPLIIQSIVQRYTTELSQILFTPEGKRQVLYSYETTGKT